MKTLFKLSLFILALFYFSESHAQMFWNQAVSFAGNTGSYLAARPTTETNITGSFTLEAWIYPTALGSNRSIISKGISTGYGMSMTNGRPAIFTNNVFRLTAKSSSALPLNQWTHVSGIYNASNDKFEIYINGELDTSSIVNSPPSSSAGDSLFAGKFNSVTYAGMMDDIRIWNRALSGAEVERNFRTFLSINPANITYSGLIFSVTFQGYGSITNVFNPLDWTINNNPLALRNLTIVDQTNKMPVTNSFNQSLEFDGSGDYAAAPSFTSIDPVGAFTMEAWVYLRDYNPGFHQSIIKKRSATTGFSMTVNSSNNLSIVINNFGSGLGTPFPLRRWVHVAFVQPAAGSSKIYIDGLQAASISYPLVQSTTDSMYVGGSPTGEAFDGYIDEVRISKLEKTQQDIKNFMYRSIDQANDFSGSDAVFNCDGNLSSSADTGPTLVFRGNTKLSNPNTEAGTPVSPMTRFDAGNFSPGFRMKTVNKKLPASGTTGAIYDSIPVNSSTAINDVNVFLAVNHTYDGDIEATLFAPNGDSAKICFDRYTTSQNTGDIIAIFDDQADSSLVNGRYTSFAPRIKPEDNFNSIFNGDNPHGIWRLKVNDDATGDTGMVYSWGIQLNGNTLVDIEGSGNNNIIPERYELFQNYPNPFNPVTTIKFNLMKAGIVKLKVYDMLGKEVAELINGYKQAGSYNADLNGSMLSSGVYFYKLEADGFTDIKKMMLVK